ncbi:ARMET-like protein precursor, partial [Dinothrombium tinctorium]
AKLKPGDCEVCEKVVDKLKQSLSNEEKGNDETIEDKFVELCSTLKNKENRFCYYMGGTEDAATRRLRDLSKLIKYDMDSFLICERLNKLDSQICELKYPKKIDIRNVDLRKLKVKELKKVLSDWDESCDGCIEKDEFVKRIEELKPKYLKEEL